MTRAIWSGSAYRVESMFTGGQTMMRSRAVRLIVGLLLFLGALAPVACTTRPISDSGYRGDTWYGPRGGGSPLYQGELSEFDVLGIDPDREIPEAEIERAFDSARPLIIPKGSRVLLIQSGGLIPDEPMVAAMGKYYGVSAFSGVPPQPGEKGYASSLRLAAAKGGCEKILAYWGILESSRTDLGTKVVSWVPFVGGVVPDESQQMRIRLKVAVVDVRSGRWEMFSPEPFGDDSRSSGLTRESSDQAQVGALKAKAYEVAVEDLVKRFAR
jgi:hypothetical protein